MKNNILTLFLVAILASCSSDNSSDIPEDSGTPETPETPDNPDTGGDGGSDTDGKKTLSIESSFDAGTTFWKTNYDTSNRPTEYFDNQDRLVNKYIYEEADTYTPTKKEFYSGSTLISTATYTYDDSKRLTKYVTGTSISNRTFEYSASEIIIRFELLPNDYTKIILDNQDRPLKIEEHVIDGSTDEITDVIDFKYENDNLIQIKKEDISFGLNSYTNDLTFDSKKNPFYNQFKENNINYLLESGFDLETRILQVYSKNNFVTQSLGEISRTFEYDGEDYPTTINTTYKEDNNKVDVEKLVYQN